VFGGVVNGMVGESDPTILKLIRKLKLMKHLPLFGSLDLGLLP
jgi:hypothetical protein